MQKKPLLTIITSMLMCSTAAYASNNTLYEQLNQGKTLISFQLQKFKFSLDNTDTDTDSSEKYKFDIDHTTFVIGVNHGVTQNFSLFATLPIKNDLSVDITYPNGQKRSNNPITGQGDLHIGFEYRLSSNTNYGQFYFDTKLATADSKENDPGTGAINYTLGGRYHYNNGVFKNSRQYIDINYTITGHKESDVSGGDVLSFNFKSVGTNKGPRLVALASFFNYFSTETDYDKSSSRNLGFLGAGINFEAEQNFELEATVELVYLSDFTYKGKSDNTQSKYKQSGLSSRFTLSAVKKF